MEQTTLTGPRRKHPPCPPIYPSTRRFPLAQPRRRPSGVICQRWGGDLGPYMAYTLVRPLTLFIRLGIPAYWLLRGRSPQTAPETRYIVIQGIKFPLGKCSRNVDHAGLRLVSSTRKPGDPPWGKWETLWGILYETTRAQCRACVLSPGLLLLLPLLWL